MVDSLRINLGGLANAYTLDKLLYFVNLGKDAVWEVVRTLDLEYFAASSQATAPTDDNYFVDLTATVREYALPPNCREIRSIECISPNFTDTIFEYRKFDDPELQDARRTSTALGASSGTDIYYYSVFGNQLWFAQFPSGTLRVKIWYIKSIDDIDTSGIPEILFPFNKKIVDFAAKRAVLSSQNLEMSLAWKSEWGDSVRILALTAGSRDSANAVFISEFCG